MTRSLALRNIYVEGDDDVAILSRWFPRLQFEAAGGKDGVHRRVGRDPESFGLLDRDFTPDDDVEASRAPSSRVAIMSSIAEAIVGQVLERADIEGRLRKWLPLPSAMCRAGGRRRTRIAGISGSSIRPFC